jgi:hypothetical protein
LRCLDKKGSGWVSCYLNDIVKLTGLSVVSIRRHLAFLKSRGWIFDFKTTQDKLWTRYASHGRLKKQLGGTYGVIAKGKLRSRASLVARATLVAALAEQHVAESKALFKLRRQDGQLVPSKMLLSMYRSSQPAGGCGYFDGKAFIRGYQTFGLSQARIAAKLGVCPKTIGRRLKDAKKVQVLKACSISETFTQEGNAAHMICADGRAYRYMPYVYFDIGYTHKQHRKLVQGRRAKEVLNDAQWEVARLSGITAGFGYSDAAAEQVIEKTGLARFRRNTKRLEQPYEYPAEGDYLESIDD